MTPPRIRAERCFALARSTKFDGERDAAIKKGVAICEREGLDLDGFDIPGRARKVTPPPASRYRDHMFATERAPGQYNAEEVSDALRRYTEQMRAASAAAAAEARARNEAMAREQGERIREQARKKREFIELRADVAANQLWKLGHKVYRAADAPDGSRRWMVDVGGQLVEKTDAELVCMVESPLEREKRVADEIQQRVNSFFEAQARAALYGKGFR